jgi:nitronate monooxygenase
MPVVKQLVCNLLNELGIQYPIIQAPMAGGATTPELVAAVSHSGGLGSLGAGYMTPEAIREAIKKIRTLTHQPFAVNLFIPQQPQVPLPEKMRQACDCIQQACRELNFTVTPVAPPFLPDFEEQMRVIIEEAVPVFSFTFGVLDSKWMLALQKKGTKIIGTATNLTEACLLEKAGVEVIVAQGSEAGGHRGTFIGKAEDALSNIGSLLTQMTDEVSIPVVAAGGVMDSKGIAALLKKGAAAVQMGTAFLTCVESGIPACYKKTLLSQTKDDTALTAAFSGKLARGIRNQFTDRMIAHKEDILDYPIQNALTAPMRKAAAMQNNTDFMSMWAGQYSYECREMSVALLMHELVQDL